MILSVSRRTDVPCYFSEWFYNRIKDGFIYVKNPMNVHQVSKINISPDVVDCIVFWTKNPKPMMSRLDELSAYNYYFQFTLTGYGKDIECNVPHKKEIMIPTFQELSKMIGPNKVIWRYDPIFFTSKYTLEYHLNAFEQIANKLNGYTTKCVISYVDIYAKNKKNMEMIDVEQVNNEILMDFSAQVSRIAKENNIVVASCAEKIDLSKCNIQHNCCIDRTMIENIFECKLNIDKDKNQRAECGCIESIDIGTYNTCRNGCKYCYANYSLESVIKNCHNYDVKSPLLCGSISSDDVITERKVKSFRKVQLGLFD